MNLSKEAILEFRELRLMNVNLMLSNIGSVVEETNCKEEDVLLLRRELLERKAIIEQKICVESPLDKEELDLLRMIVEEE